jgi:hypothetical protein
MQLARYQVFELGQPFTAQQVRAVFARLRLKPKEDISNECIQFMLRHLAPCTEEEVSIIDYLVANDFRLAVLRPHWWNGKTFAQSVNVYAYYYDMSKYRLCDFATMVAYSDSHIPHLCQYMCTWVDIDRLFADDWDVNRVYVVLDYVIALGYERGYIHDFTNERLLQLVSCRYFRALHVFLRVMPADTVISTETIQKLETLGLFTVICLLRKYKRIL